MGLIQAIPKRYKQIVLENKKGVCNDNIDRIMQQKEKVVKLIYETKLERNKQFPEKAFLKIKALLETEMTRDTFLNYFNLAETATTSNKLREFQYRILHSILTTNSTLKAWNIRNVPFARRNLRPLNIYYFSVITAESYGTMYRNLHKIDLASLFNSLILK